MWSLIHVRQFAWLRWCAHIPSLARFLVCVFFWPSDNRDLIIMPVPRFSSISYAHYTFPFFLYCPVFARFSFLFQSLIHFSCCCGCCCANVIALCQRRIHICDANRACMWTLVHQKNLEWTLNKRANTVQYIFITVDSAWIVWIEIAQSCACVSACVRIPMQLLLSSSVCVYFISCVVNRSIGRHFRNAWCRCPFLYTLP